MLEKLRAFVESAPFQAVVLALILVNAVILGAETLAPVKESYLDVLMHIDRAIIYAFTIEVALRIVAYRVDYFRSGWNLFDLAIVIVSLVAATSGLAAIRAFRVLRVLRVVTVFPRMRLVVSALFDSIPGIASGGIVLVLIVYVFAVIAANLYGPLHNELFGDVFAAMYTLFQVMTLEGWAEIADEVAQTHPNSWIFFLSFVFIATFTMLNLFVAIVVRVVDEDAEEAEAADGALLDQREELRRLRAEISSLKASIDTLLETRR
ncbi:MAG: ion transporter [Pseudomonadota bacterium]